MSKIVETYLKFFSDNSIVEYFDDVEIDFIEGVLTRRDEINSDKTDQWGNWDCQFEHRDYSQPYLDLFVLDRMKEKGITRNKRWGEHSFAVCLSHDVDRVESYSARTFRRNLKKRICFSSSPANTFKLYLNYFKTSVKSIFERKNADTLWCYEKWVDIELKYDALSTYFFFVRPEKQNNIAIYDCDYVLSDNLKYRGVKMSVSQYINELQKSGAEIGLHGSYQSFDSGKLFSEQKKALEKVIQQPVLSTRQHYLHFSVQSTPNVHKSNGIVADSTIGYNTDVGFRSGTAIPYFLDSESTLLEIPLVIMDSALFQKNETLESAKNKIFELFDSVENVGGCISINFHPDYIVIPKYFDCYIFILEEIKRRNVKTFLFKDLNAEIQKICVE